MQACPVTPEAAEPVESVSSWLHGIQLKANATAEKFAKVAADIRQADADERAEEEERFQAKHDAYWSAIAADRDEGDRP